MLRVTGLLWVFATVQLVGCLHNQCMLQDGKCFYHVQLMPGCSLPNIETNSLQNDNDQRVNEIEKSLTDVRVDHARRIKELENKISNLLTDPPQHEIDIDLDTDKDDVLITPNVEHAGRHRHNRKKEPPYQENPKKKENELLNMLHTQFSGLRHDLATSRRKLRETEYALRDVRHKLNLTELALVETNKKLIETEAALEETKAENWRLRQELEQKIEELNTTKAKLHATLKRMRRAELELWDVKMDNERLRKDIKDLQETLEMTRKLLSEALRKYHELNIRHDVAVQEVQNKTEQLVECYKGKTSQFCGFEDEGICGFHQENGTDYMDWNRMNLKTPSSRTGPSSDHTCGNERGYYMYVEASSKGQGQTAVMVSPKYQGVEEQCVEFFYHMYGRHIGTLNVYTRISEEEFIQAWRAYGNQGNVWTIARMPIKEEVARKGYEVIFEAILEKGYEGDVAVDDFRVLDGACYHKKKTEDGSVSNTTGITTEASVTPRPPVSP